MLLTSGYTRAVKPCKLAPHSGNSGMLASHYFLFNILSLFSLFSLFSLYLLSLSLSHTHPPTHPHTHNRDALVACEQDVLRTLGFCIQPPLPFNYLLNYLKALNATPMLSGAAFAILNEVSILHILIHTHTHTHTHPHTHTHTHTNTHTHTQTLCCYTHVMQILHYILFCFRKHPSL